MPVATTARERLDVIKQRLSSGTLDEREAQALSAEIALLLRRLAKERWRPYPWQVPPVAVPTLGTWLMLGGRGTGKTEGCAHYLDDHMDGPPCDTSIKGGHRCAIVAPTLGDAVDACYAGPSGLKTINPGVDLKGGVEGTRVIWPSGATARLFGVFTRDDVERLRAGGNRCLVWLEEAAAMRFLREALEHTGLGLRIGANPHYIASTTPKVRRDLRQMIADPRTIMTRGSTRQAYHLAESVRQVYFDRYNGTRLGRQELDAEILDDIEGALWASGLIEQHRVNEPPVMQRIVIGVDPPGGKAECGIVAVGVDDNHHLYVLGDYSFVATPAEWGAEVVRVYHLLKADKVIAEKNYGGDMVKNTIATVPDSDDVSVKTVTARQGKQLRAEPVHALYEVGRVHHVGTLVDLETQQTEWVPGDESPDRLDALVHACTDLAVRHGLVVISNPASLHRRDTAPTTSGPTRRRTAGSSTSRLPR